MGNELAAGLGAGDGRPLALDLAALGLGLALALALALADAVGVSGAETDGVARPLAAGENGVGVAEGEPDEQAETAAGASMVKMATPKAVSLALGPVPAMAVRILWDLPHASGRWLASSLGLASSTGAG